MAVALSIMGLAFAVASSIQGPALARGRALERDAQFWLAFEPVRLTLQELAAGAVDTDATAASASNSIHLKTLAPRLSSSPLAVDIRVIDENKLTITAPPLTAVVLQDGPPLRLRAEYQTIEVPKQGKRLSALLLDAKDHGMWRPLMRAPVPSNAPLACDFDPIPRTCR